MLNITTNTCKKKSSPKKQPLNSHILLVNVQVILYYAQPICIAEDGVIVFGKLKFKVNFQSCYSVQPMFFAPLFAMQCCMPPHCVQRNRRDKMKGLIPLYSRSYNVFHW